MADTSVSYKCPECGAPLSYLPSDTEVTCEYCMSKFSVEKLKEIFTAQEERAAKAAAAQEKKWETELAGNEYSADEVAQMQTYVCSSCGAELSCDSNTMATECCYCGNPTMLPNRFNGMLKPDYIIPFKKTKEDAVKALKEFYNGKKLLPDAFTANNRVEAIQGMYVPFWLFDTKVSATGNFTVEREGMTYRQGNCNVTEIDTYDCERVVEVAFENVPADGSERMDDDYMDSVEPYDYSEMVPFDNMYMTGFLADKYDVEADACAARIDERIDNTVRDKLIASVGMGSIKGQDIVIDKGERSVKYAMAPVWILTTRYQDKPYTFMMNGQTGKMVGDLPSDSGKEHKYMMMAFAAVAAIMFVFLKMVL
ncbi:MAG: hypothetical protein Q4D21_05130 [Phascolarctobacterium sp.]|nr:hypothetical protein [Phascolarctobacterium sp.]